MYGLIDMTEEGDFLSSSLKKVLKSIGGTRMVFWVLQFLVSGE